MSSFLGKAINDRLAEKDMQDKKSTHQTIQDFKTREDNHRIADNFKIISIFILTLSALAFSMIGKEGVQPYIWYWAAFMGLLLLINIILDIIASMKDKRMGL